MKMVWVKDYYSPFSECTSIRVCLAYIALMAARDGGGGGGLLPYKRLVGMCRWMGPHFQEWSDYNGVAFSRELLEWGRAFSDFWG